MSGLFAAIVRNAPKVAAGTFAALALLWSVWTIPGSEDIDKLVDFRDVLLRSGVYRTEQLSQVYDQLQHQDALRCESEAQTALLIVQLQLSQNALMSGFAEEFDRRLADAGDRVQTALGCVPSLSYVWLLGYWTRVMSGHLDAKSLAMLQVSYDTAPNEGWIASRRNGAAMRVIAVAPDELRRRIVREFRLLVRDGYAKEAAASYAAAPEAIRASLHDALEGLGPRSLSEFNEALKAKAPGTAPQDKAEFAQ